MNPSPYFTGATGGFGPPSGMAALISQDREMAAHPDMSGWQQFADVAEKYKNKQDMAKSMDYFFKANPDALAEMGIHPEEYKTLGADDRIAAGKGYVMGQAQKSVMQQMAEVGQRLQAQRDSQAATQAFARTMGTAQGQVDNATLAAGNGPVVPRPLDMNDFVVAAAQNPNAWTAPEARPFLEEMAKAGTHVRGMPQMINLGGVDLFANPATGMFEQSVNSKMKAELDKEKQVIATRAASYINKGLLPPGTTTTVDASGVVVATTPDGWVKPLGKASDLAVWNASSTGSSNPAASKPTLRFRKNPKTGKPEQY